CSGGTSAPRKCPPGTANPLPAKGDLQDCQTCPSGSISTDSRADCRPCPIGFSCDPMTGHLDHCKPSQYSLEGELHCSECPDGFVCPDGRHWELCPPGKEPAQNRAHCIDCLPGFFSTRDSPKCVPCLPGSYCPDVAKMYQFIHPIGSLKNGQGAFNSCICINGTPSEDTAEPRRSNTDTITCSPGYYTSLAGHQDCQSCPS
ncbi:Hypothetical predicted protein, partial [Pelobates cultripes]